MACACKGRPKCADGRKMWYEKMKKAKAMKRGMKMEKKEMLKRMKK